MLLRWRAYMLCYMLLKMKYGLLFARRLTKKSA